MEQSNRPSNVYWVEIKFLTAMNQFYTEKNIVRGATADEAMDNMEKEMIRKKGLKKVKFCEATQMN